MRALGALSVTAVAGCYFWVFVIAYASFTFYIAYAVISKVLSGKAGDAGFFRRLRLSYLNSSIKLAMPVLLMSLTQR